MASTTPGDPIIRRQIESVEFGFYSDEDVRSRSVCEITSSVSVDALGNPLPNGVYDPRLGPANAESQPCTTCALRYLGCPGHFGHIELCVPVYHPLLFGKLVELLRIKCFNCHRLTAPSGQLDVYKVKFELIRRGRYSEALALDDRLASVMKDSKERNDETKRAASIQSALLAVDEALKEISESMSSTAHVQKISSFEEACYRDLVKEVLSNCRSAKSCPHCGAFSPRIRQDSSNKIFQSPLAATSKRINEAEGIVIVPALVNGKGGSERENGDSVKENQTNTASINDEGDEEQPNPEGGSSRDKYMHPSEVKAQVQRTWATNPDLCKALFAVQGSGVFFLQAVAVPPNRFRPPMHLGGMVVEHAQNMYLNKIMTSNEMVRVNFVNKSEANAYKHWIDLQTHLNCYMDSSKDPSMNQNISPGIRQLLERKEGIFRKHMMGKRVNFACRSVISPDPYIGTNEIGIPRHFAVTLTYPTPVTDINIEEMKTLVERGPDQYPGARWVEFPDRRVDLSKMDEHKREAAASMLLKYAKKGGQPAIVGRQMRDGDMVLMNRQCLLDTDSYGDRWAAEMLLYLPPGGSNLFCLLWPFERFYKSPHTFLSKPTLHKPGIMAHEVRVLHSPTQKTIRMHYANCNTYNADFDGDEMNCHFPQSDLGRAEAEYLAKTDLQYIVPTDGSPLRGLIQDHVVAGVKLTKRDTFLEKWEYQQLLFATLASLPRLEIIRSDSNIELMPPAVMKPKPLWTGKQVISTLLNHLRKGNDRDFRSKTLAGISTERKAKTPGAAFGTVHEENLVLIRDGELLRGVLDKAAFGATDFSLVHAVYEAYGPSKAGLLLNALGRLFTAYLQYFSGHSCRMEDLILTKASDSVRRGLINKAYNMGSRAARAWANSEGGKVPIELDESEDKGPLKPVESAAAAFKVRQLLSGNEGKNNSAAFDGFMMSKLNPLASDIVKACLPDGLAVAFPINTFGIMVTTGAKGSIVNQSQVSCALGQQALEGRRVPRMSSGRTLPSFAPFDVNPRADGFVMDRFLTGIRPQEYYFHCMAGREGLVDTAVKTSRSGYLQRCLVKHLEEVKVCYDYTVRNGEGGVLQFLYGEDGLDPTKASYLDCSETSFVYMARNSQSLEQGQVALPGATIELASADAERNAEVKNATEDRTILNVGDFVLARRLRFGSKWARGSICEGWFNAKIIKKDKKGKVFDVEYQKDGHVEKAVPTMVNFDRNSAVSSSCQLIKPAAADPIVSSSRSLYRLGTSGACVSERLALAASKAAKNSRKLQQVLQQGNMSATRFGTLVAAKYGAALCAPGEAVGSIAAQSVGEPSTQMTLNTFHLAGAGANVTLGIPRLREIIMTASRELKTPTMSVPLLDGVTDSEATKLTRSFTKLTLNELIAGHQGVHVRETLAQSDSGLWQRAYYVTLKLHPAERIKTAFGLTLKDIAQVVAKHFVPALSTQMKLELRRSATDGEGIISVEGGSSSDIVDEEGRLKSRKKNDGSDLLDDEDGDDDESVEIAAPEDGARANRSQAESYDNQYDDDDDDLDSINAASNGDSNVEVSESEDGDSSKQNVTTPLQSESSFTDSAIGVKIDDGRNLIYLQPLRVDPSARPLLMVGLVEKAAAKTLVRSRKNIEQAFINKEEERGRCLQTAGINFSEIWELERVDHTNLLSNDIWAVRCAYGVEAARNTIVDQIRSVFGVYGIEVDPRHLSLIADYMTFSGGYTAMSRTGMREMSSPFLQMSFETTAQFLTQAALISTKDDLQSPSANIVVGRPIRHGTGAFSLLAK